VTRVGLETFKEAVIYPSL